MSDYPVDYFDGAPREPLVLTSSRVMRGNHEGSVYVQRGVQLRLEGVIQGSLTLEEGAEAEIIGSHQGSLHVAPAASARITGSQEGSVHNEGTVVVEKSGTAGGSIENDGTLIIRGRQGGEITGLGRTEIADDARIIRPTRENGVNVYRYE